MSKRIFALAGLLGLAVTLVRAEPVGLAVAEDANWDAEYPDQHRQIYEPRVRALFVKDSAGWRLACKAESRFRPLCEEQDARPFALLNDFVHGRTTSYRPKGFQAGYSCYEHSCSSPGWLDIDPAKIESGIDDRLNTYSGMSFQPARKPRPLTSLDRPIGDPQKWKASQPAALTADERGWVIDSLAKLMICPKGESPPFQKVTLKLTAQHLKVDKRYVNSKAESIQLVTVSDRVKQECEQLGGRVTSGSEIHAPWMMLVRSANGRTARHVLLGRIAELPDSTKYAAVFAAPDLIQFGDFDGDGQSEALFYLRSYMERGYLLLHDSMLKSVRFSYGGN